MILHLDLDCFFVSAARIKDPSLIGKNVAVVGGGGSAIFGDEESLGGVVLSPSYEARKFGVKSAMPLKKAQNLCKDLILVKADHGFYKELSQKLYKFLYSFTPDIEAFSIDEFFMDLKGIEAKNDPLNFAKNLQSKILEKLNLPCSIGLSEAKFIAKLTTDLVKPFGVGMIKVNEIKDKLGDVDIAKFPFVGKSSQNYLKKHGIFTIKDAFEAKFVFEKMGKNGLKIYENIIGASRELELNKERKSISYGRTFEAIMDRNEIQRRIFVLCRYLSFSIYKFGKTPTKFEFRLRYIGRETHTKSFSLKESFSENLLDRVMSELFREADIRKTLSITHISVGVGGFLDTKVKTLFSDESALKLNNTLQSLRQKHGIEILKTAKELG
ncbi:DNA polymerase IV [Campylobacter corcagiensis]|uniref:DNA polymerase IV n=1 Tax=Campylobacter corcagiensis TaxID=1448857 RepID=A0A7M1LFK4_9BACT|nr:DNA polymerase IV [Campylobacter corcagiensis]QKF64504.1 DNA polymerase IV [Campylobacter corcagiensis]QOQ87318.1 DNA polymerase IV [Campylobacter corcagiensis]